MPVSDWENKRFEGQAMYRLAVKSYDPVSGTVTDVDGRAWVVLKEVADKGWDFKNVMHVTPANQAVNAFWYEDEAALVFPEFIKKALIKSKARYLGSSS
jgi:hypothetical protein